MSKKISNIKSKVKYERGKVEKLQEKIRKIGGRFNSQLVQLDVNLEVVKEILFEEKKITEDEFDLRYLKKVQFILKEIYERMKEAKRKQTRIIIPKANLPKDIREGFKA